MSNDSRPVTEPGEQGELPGQEQPATEACAVCGRRFPISKLTWEHNMLLCPLCLAEQQSCGCSD